MEEIKVGEYVRTPEQGFVGKLVEINKDVLNYYKIDIGREICRANGMSDNYIYSRDGFGLKHSPNPIDLIKVGDYVNGEKVIKILDGFIEGTMELKLSNNKKIYRTNANEIKSIVTKEMIESIKYEVE